MIMFTNKKSPSLKYDELVYPIFILLVRVSAICHHSFNLMDYEKNLFSILCEK